MSRKPRLVIVGGGVAGLALATRLGRSLGRAGKADVTLIDRSLTHAWKPMLHCFAAGTALNEADRIPFAAQAAAHSFTFSCGEISALDRENRRITLAPLVEGDETVLAERTLEYDGLVLAIGSRANDFGTPGVAEHSLFLDNLADANSFNDRFRKAILEAAARGTALNIAIVGGGATGTQLAAELHRAMDLIADYRFVSDRPPLKIAVLEAGPRILPAFPEHVAEEACEQFRKLGIEVRTQAMVSGADEHGYLLKDGTRVDADLRVWAAGVCAPGVTSELGGLACSRSGQLLVRETLQTIEDDHIFALGDCARIEENPLAPTAQAARQQAHYLAAHMGAWLDGKPMPPFRYHDRGAIIALAHYNGWGVMPGGKTFGGGAQHGLLARLGHLALYRQHQFELYGLFRGVMSCVADWFASAVRPLVRLG